MKTAKWSKIVTTTALGDPTHVIGAYQNLCDAYVANPIDKAKLREELQKSGKIIH